MHRSEFHHVAIGLGSNLGDRRSQLCFGYESLKDHLEDLRGSSIYRTTPVEVTDQPEFLNACCIGRTRLTPHQLLAELQHVEKLAHRRRGERRFGPRTLDLDLLLYDDRTIEDEDLVVPHPRLRGRAFVLVPLEEIAGDWRVPASGDEPERRVRELADAVGAEGVVPTDWKLEESECGGG